MRASCLAGRTYLTQDDKNNYGTDLIDVTQRAALHAVAPHLQNLEQQNAELRQRLAIEARARLDSQVERAVPNYREIDRDPRWHRFLLETDPYIGRPRQLLLNDAVASGDVSRVAAFFRGFQQASGTQASRPATGGSASVPSQKPIYTRAQIQQLYRAHQQGAYVGREAEWARQDADIIAAGREGRIRNPVWQVA
jgi:hypothetical protein